MPGKFKIFWMQATDGDRNQMPDLEKQLANACDRAIERLSDLHDDYFHTNQLWLELLAGQRHGKSFIARNAKTGVVIIDESHLLDRARTSQQRLRVRTFKDLAGELELYIGDVLRVWLNAFPQLVDGRSITLATVLAASDLESTRQLAIEEAVNAAILDKLTGKPTKWFSFMKNQLGVQIPAADVEAYTERKAARDVLEHHSGVVDPGYINKAGTAVRFNQGDLFEPDDAALNEIYDLIHRLISKIAIEIEKKLAEVTKSGITA